MSLTCLIAPQRGHLISRAIAVPFASNRPQLRHLISLSIPRMLKVPSCAPEHRLIAFVRPVLRAYDRRILRMMLLSSCGAVVRRLVAGPVGEGPISPASA